MVASGVEGSYLRFFFNLLCEFPCSYLLNLCTKFAAALFTKPQLLIFIETINEFV